METKMKDIIIKAKQFYEFYCTKCKKADDASIHANDEMYSKAYSGKVAAQSREMKIQAGTELKGQLDELREEFEEVAIKESGILTDIPDRRILSVFNSGVQLSECEFLALAKEFYGDPLNSRIIHDHAKRAGYEINNYLSIEKCMNIFNDYLRNIEFSTEENSAFVPIPPEYSDKIAENYIKMLYPSILDLHIEKTAKNIEEGIAKDMIKHREQEESKLDEVAFLCGLDR